MHAPIRLAVHGAGGRMGRALVELLSHDRRFLLAQAVVAPGSALDGQPLHGSLRYVHDWSAAPALDVVIDFSAPSAFDAVLAYCTEHGVALVSGTTGLSPSQHAALDAAAARVPMLHAANFSLGVAVLGRLLADAATILRDWDLEIVEAHHGRKRDAPSGTALALGEAAARARGVALDGVRAETSRQGTRRAGEIGFAVMRGGDVVGEHAAWLLGAGERVELAHRATDRAIFARGALEAAAWLVSRPAGMYRIDDLLADRLAR